MKEILQNLYDFFESTTIHGLSYLTNDKSRSTRLIWFIIVITALTVAGYFLSETVAGYNTKFTSTTQETKNVKDYPFPAVTFYPGDANSEKGFLRAFLNQFQLTRFEGKIMQNNTIFLRSYEWLLGLLTKCLFDGIEKYLIEQKIFINSKWKIFKNEVCGLVALEKLRNVSMKDELRSIYKRNLFKFKGFSPVKTFIKDEISPAIEKNINQNNLTKSDISSSCNDKIQKEKAARILSFLFLFIDKEVNDIGPGDIASNFQTSLKRIYGAEQTAIFESAHIGLTKIFTDMVKGSVSGSALETPTYFLDPSTNIEEIDVALARKTKKLGFLNISMEIFHTYQLLWYSYNHVTDGKYTRYCQYSPKQTCSDLSQYTYPTSKNSFIIAEFIRQSV